MRKFKKCDSDFCDKDTYYLNQAGGKLDDIVVYRGRPYQTGNGIISKYAIRYGIPVLKYLGKQALNTGRNILMDVFKGENVKSSAIKNLKRQTAESLNDASDLIRQSGSGRKRKRVRKNKSNKRKKIVNMNTKVKSKRRRKIRIKKAKKSKKSKVKRYKKVKKTNRSKKLKDIFS